MGWADTPELNHQIHSANNSRCCQESEIKQGSLEGLKHEPETQGQHSAA